MLERHPRGHGDTGDAGGEALGDSGVCLLARPVIDKRRVRRPTSRVCFP